MITDTERTKAELLQDLVEGRLPDEAGRFGPFGGRAVPPPLEAALARLEREARAALADPAFRAALDAELRDYAGRPTPLTEARALSAAWGARILLKREDLLHLGAHKINNALGQALLARRMGAARIVAETGAGQHGVASAAAAARVGLPCRVYMGAADMARQAPNVDRMRRLGAEVVAASAGSATLCAAVDAALADYAQAPRATFYLLGSAVGPHPYPWLVRELQAVIGREARAQVARRLGRLPDAAIACVGGGSNAIGLFHAFVPDRGVRLVGVEGGGRGPGRGEHAATMTRGRVGAIHGFVSLVLRDDDGGTPPTHSISAGLDYPGVGPEHALLAHAGRAEYVAATDDEAVEAFDALCRLEGIVPALESAHALAGARRLARENPGAALLVNLSGRGDKDLPQLAARRGAGSR